MENSGRRIYCRYNHRSTSYQVQARFKMFLFFRDIGKNQQVYTYSLVWSKCLWNISYIQPAYRSQYTVCHCFSDLAASVDWKRFQDSTNACASPRGFFVGRENHALQLTFQKKHPLNQLCKRNENCLCNWILFFFNVDPDNQVRKRFCYIRKSRGRKRSQQVETLSLASTVFGKGVGPIQTRALALEVR